MSVLPLKQTFLSILPRRPGGRPLKVRGTYRTPRSWMDGLPRRTTSVGHRSILTKMWTGYLKPTIVSLEIEPDFARLLAQAIPFYREKTSYFCFVPSCGVV